MLININLLIFYYQISIHNIFCFVFILDEDGEKSVSVLLDAEESELIFLDKSNSVSETKFYFNYFLR